MDEQIRRRKPLRRRRTKMEVFKEAYLPYIILLITVVLVIIFIIGSATRKGAGADGESAAYSALQNSSQSMEV